MPPPPDIHIPLHQPSPADGQHLTGKALLTFVIAAEHRLRYTKAGLTWTAPPVPSCPACDTQTTDYHLQKPNLASMEGIFRVLFEPCGHLFFIQPAELGALGDRVEAEVSDLMNRPAGERQAPVVAHFRLEPAILPDDNPNVCVFCRIVAGQATTQRVKVWDNALAIVPLNPVVPGHVIVIPHQHVPDAAEDPDTTAATMRRAAEYAKYVGGPANLITSIGAEATQTVFHLHIHVVPRAAGDGLTLPWTGQQARAGR